MSNSHRSIARALILPALPVMFLARPAAAAAVCALPEDWQPRNEALLAERGKCIDHAVARAVRAVRNDNLSAYHWRRISAWKHRFGEAPTAGSALPPLDSATPSG